MIAPGWRDGIKAAVSFSFDDARISQIDNGMALFGEYGVKATFYVSPEAMRKRLAGWREAVTAGHEIGNHTSRHPCSGNFPFSRSTALEDYTFDKMRAEIAEADGIIGDLLGVRPRTFAYPCGQTFIGRGRDTLSYVPLVAERFIAGRGFRDEYGNAPGFCDLSRLNGTDGDGCTAEELIRYIAKAAEEGTWIIFCGHEIGTDGIRQTTGIRALRETLAYLGENRGTIWTAPVAEVAAFLIDAETSAKNTGGEGCTG